MKILHVISKLSLRTGGPTMVVRTLAPYQAGAGLDITVCSTNSYDSTKVSLSRDRDVHGDSKDVKYYYFSAMTPLMVSYEMARWFRDALVHFDLVHIHGLYRFPVTCAAWLSRKKGVPYVIMPHGSLDPYLYRQSRYNLLLKRIYERLFDIPNLNRAAAIHYTAQEEAERASFLRLRARPIIVPNGIDWETYRHLPAKGSFRDRLGVGDRTPLCLFLGRINFKKGLDLLVSAFARVLDKYFSARLAIVGPDNEGYRTKVKHWCLEQGILDKVFFVDHLGQEDVKRAYVDADVFVLSSYTENFGLTVVEAMACGCPVVISNQVNIWREIQETGAGIVIGLDPIEIAEAICRVLANKDRAKIMGTQGRLVAERRYSWPRIVDQMTQVYREVIEEAAAKRRLGN